MTRPFPSQITFSAILHRSPQPPQYHSLTFSPTKPPILKIVYAVKPYSAAP